MLNEVITVMSDFNLHENSSKQDPVQPNFPLDQINSSSDWVFGTEELPWEPHNIVAVVLSTLAVGANILSLLAIVHVRGGLTTHYRLVVSLGLSDILIAVSVLLHKVNSHVNPRVSRPENPMDSLLQDCAFVFIKALNTTSLNISLLNLMGMAIDHYLAILKAFQYANIMNSRNGSIMITMLWIIAIVCGFSDFLSGIAKYHLFKNQYNYCDFIFETTYQDEYTVFAIALICLFVLTYIYLRIYIEIRRIQLRNNGARYMRKNIKATVTTLLILGSFMLCWLPQCLFEISMIIQVKLDAKKLLSLVRAYVHANRYLYNLLLLNCILDPVIYAIRMRDVQHGYKKLFASCRRKQEFCNSTSAGLLNSKKDSKSSQFGCNLLRDTHM